MAMGRFLKMAGICGLALVWGGTTILRGVSWGASPPGFVLRKLDWKGQSWVVAEVDLNRVSLDLVGQRAVAPTPHTLGRTARAVQAQGQEVLFATNAGIYQKDRRPLGLQIEAGTVVHDLNTHTGAGNFYLLPNGVFAVGAQGAVVLPTAEVPAASIDWRIASQSGPLLVSNGKVHPAFDPASTSQKTRSGVGVRDPGHVVFAVSTEPVRFFDMATLFRDALGCADALYLDGTISDYWTPERSHIEGDPRGYGGVFVVTAAGAPARTGP